MTSPAFRTRLVRTVAAMGGTSLAVTAALVGIGSVAAQAAAPGLSVSEVAPWGSGNSPYAADWFELTNNAATALDITGWKFDDDSSSFGSSVALNGITTVAAGESVVFLETASASTVAQFRSFWSTPAGVQVGTYSGSGVGLSTSGDAVNIFDASGTVKAHVTFGASSASAPYASFDNAAGVDGAISTKSVAGTHGAVLVGTPPAPAGQSAIGSPGTISGGATPNPSPSPSPSPSPTVSPSPSGNAPWPGGPGLDVVDNADLSAGNLSGLSYVGSGSSAPGTMWAVQNGPSVLFKLAYDGTHWVPEAGNWSAGKSLHYPDGTGDPDAEGVTVGGPTTASGIFVSTERDNLNSGVSKLAVLRYDANATGGSINATAQWDLTSALPATGANLGLEAITWVPDSFLVGHGLRDSATGLAYDPASYPGHGAGLFFVGVEGSGQIYGFALDQTGTTYHLVTSFTSGFSSVMEDTFDADTGLFWAHCDNTCSNVSTTLQISPSTGTFAVAARYDRPAGMDATMNNEGFTIAPDSECVNNLKPVYFSDDGDTGGFSLRRGSLTCGAQPAASLPEFALPTLALLGALGVGGALVLASRRRAAAA